MELTKKEEGQLVRTILLVKDGNSLPDLTDTKSIEDSHDNKMSEITQTISNIQVEANSMIYARRDLKNGRKIIGKESENMIGFFGKINPLSNFYSSSFTHEGVQYISSEQLIQANKAKLFRDVETYNQILCCTTSLECKNLSRQIRNVDERKWEEEAVNTCFPGIRAKFHQNINAMDTLLNKTGMKRIVECASD